MPAGPCKASVIHYVEPIIPYIRTVGQDEDRRRDDSKEPSGQLTLTELLEVHPEQRRGERQRDEESCQQG